jgi:uncharacterized protein (DUF1501 family)
MRRPSRRDFLGLSAGFALLPLPARADAAAQRRLVVVMLRGAVDGLSVVIPYAEEAYYQSRPSIAIARPGGAEGAGIALDAHFALHPALAGLVPLWQQRQLAFIHAAGSSDATRSHFDAQLYIENGTPGRRATADGWMNRLLAALPGPHTAGEAVAVGPVLPKILEGKVAAANLPLGRNAGRAIAIDRPEAGHAFDRLYAGDDPISRSYREGRTARGELMAGMAAERQIADNGAPSANSFPVQAGQLAGLMSRDPRVRFVFLGLGGWDTHVRQGNHQGQLADQLKSLGEGLMALARGIGPAWNDTVVVVISEFGRTVRENGNGGTDHGHGNAMWVLGGQVAGGRVYGEWPGLRPSDLYEGRDLAVTTDYRNILAAVAQRHLRLADASLEQVFPGLPRASGELGKILPM